MPPASPVLLSSARAPALSAEEAAAYTQAAFAENAFARANYEALIGDGSKARFDTPLASVMTAKTFLALRLRLAAAGVSDNPITYGDVFNAVVYLSDGRPMLDHALLLATGILSPEVTETRLRDALRFHDDGRHARAPKNAAYPRGMGYTGTPGHEVIGRTTDGDVYIYGSEMAAKTGKLMGNGTNPFDVENAFIDLLRGWRAHPRR